MNPGTIEITDRRSGIERRQTEMTVDTDKRVSIRRRNEALKVSPAVSSLELKREIAVEPAPDAPLTDAEQKLLSKLSERRARQMANVKTGTQLHEIAVNNGDELAFHQTRQGGYPESQDNLLNR